MAGTLRLSNTGTGNGQSTITTAASGDTTYTLPSGGGTFVTTGSTQALTVAFASGTVSAPSITFLGDSNTGIYSPAADTIAFTEGGVESVRIDSSGRVGIGTSGPAARLHVEQSSDIALYLNRATSDGEIARFAVGGTSAFQFSTTSTTRDIHIPGGTAALTFTLNSTERARIDSSGRLLIGTSSTSQTSSIVVQGNNSSSVDEAVIRMANGSSTPGVGAYLGNLIFTDSGHQTAAFIGAMRDGGTWSASSKPSRLVFSTTADGASSPTERLRITSDGDTFIGKTGFSSSTAGIELQKAGTVYATRDGSVCGLWNRLTSDGDIIIIQQASVTEGSISVSGTTVSYNGAHLSRWSQLPSGAERTEILRGSVLSNVDEMCEWGDEENEQLNRMKVSDVEGDKNVSGVFQAWDDDDDTYTNDFYCAMTGDFIIRIAGDVTVERGDLLMSAGDGTAKPQDDDIIRSKTIAKVTSTNVTCTYDDGSYCVPCVLMAC